MKGTAVKHTSIRTRFIRLTFVVATAGLTACQPPGLLRANTTAVPDPTCLALRPEVPRRVEVGMKAILTLVVENTCNYSLNVFLEGQPGYDFVLETLNGGVVWENSHGFLLTDSLERKRLKANQALEFRGEWRGSRNDGSLVSAGSYRAFGVLNVRSVGTAAMNPESAGVLKTSPLVLTVVPNHR